MPLNNNRSADFSCGTCRVCWRRQADKAGARLKQLKRQVEEGEEELARVTAQKRKLQRDVEEQTEQAESTQRELDQLRSKLRTGGSAGDKARSVPAQLRV